MTTLSAVRRFRRHIPFFAIALVFGSTISGAGPALSALPSGPAVTSASTWGSSITIQRPSATVAGDVLVASVSARVSGTTSIGAPSGWNLVRRDSGTSGYGNLTQAVYYKVAGALEPASYAWALGSSTSATGGILDAKGVDRVTPIDSHSGAFVPYTRNPLAPSVRTTVAGDIVVGFFAITASKSIRPPSGMTEEFDRTWSSSSWSLGGEGAANIQSTAFPPSPW